jgi:predicted ABC-type ATPase
MTVSKQLWVLAGGNGSGKSTFYRLILAPRGLKLVNADLIAREINPEHPEQFSYEAAEIAARIMRDLLYQGVSFCFETVFSHESKIDFVAEAKALGYEIILVYIHLDTPELNEARVQQRVTEGGHTVPAGKIRSRIPRTMRHIAVVLPLADQARLLNNSSAKNPFMELARVIKGRCVKQVDPLPPWAAGLLKNIL